MTDIHMHDTTPLGKVKSWLRERLHDGANCPACGQRVQLYKRKLNSGMARALIQIYNHAETEWVKVQDIPDAPKGGDYAKLRFWGLLESSGDRADDGNSAGMWRVTEHGRAFVLNISTVPAYVGTYNNRTYRLPDADEVPLISIKDAIGSKFNYDELIRA